MAFAGKSDKKENVTAAIAANIWMSNERSAKGALPDETLDYIALDCLVSDGGSLRLGIELQEFTITSCTHTHTHTGWKGSNEESSQPSPLHLRQQQHRTRPSQS